MSSGTRGLCRHQADARRLDEMIVADEQAVRAFALVGMEEEMGEGLGAVGRRRGMEEVRPVRPHLEAARARLHDQALIPLLLVALGADHRHALAPAHGEMVERGGEEGLPIELHCGHARMVPLRTHDRHLGQLGGNGPAARHRRGSCSSSPPRRGAGSADPRRADAHRRRDGRRCWCRCAARRRCACAPAWLRPGPARRRGPPAGRG